MKNKFHHKGDCCAVFAVIKERYQPTSKYMRVERCVGEHLPIRFIRIYPATRHISNEKPLIRKSCSVREEKRQSDKSTGK